MSQPPASAIRSRNITAHHLVDELTVGLRATADEVVPWFLQSMPRMYFQDTDHATRLEHLRAIIAAKASGRPIELTLRADDGSQWTFMRPEDKPGVLAELVHTLPTDRPLRAAKIHTATDGQLVLDVFEFGEGDRFDANDTRQHDKLAQTIAYASKNLPQWSADEVRDYFSRCTEDYVQTITPLRMCRQWELYKRLSGTEGTAVSIEPESDPNQSRIVVAVGNATTRTMLERISTRLSRSDINIHRAYLDVIDDGTNGEIVLLGFVVEAPQGTAIDPSNGLWTDVQRDLLRLKWLDPRTLDLAYRNPGLTLKRAEVITALCALIHQALIKVNAYAFNLDRIFKLAEKNLDFTTRIADLFLARFNPESPLKPEEFASQVAALEQDIDTKVDLEDARTLLHRLLDAVHAVLRTNVYLDERYALSMRIDPALLATAERSEPPFGVFFVHGREFNGFHVRFRDIARGGVRAIRPFGVDQHGREAERLYDEAYHLAQAQQLKNKDIPEGGSKAAILLEQDAKIDRCVKAFVDSLLDLITPSEETTSKIVDLFGQPELLYLGPDENITPELIDWIVDRAKRRGYSSPTALMSSKPGAGINHKQYGVTSEGVNVFLYVALLSVGIDATKDPFTVKITGGPDGDVAGNLIRILDRDYKGNARVVGIADGSGSGEDPDGLDHEELIRLVNLSLPIARFDRSKLGPKGRIVAVDEPDGVQLRNTLHNRVVADAFVPCGGRPNAIHAGNWRDYLNKDGTPSSRVIVEGANLFLTPEARQELSDLGALILKDSSANKCGVICSSFEIVASMLLSEEEFLTIKETFVEQVLDRLRTLAQREAELLLRLHHHRPHVPMPEMSIRLSRVMIRTADAIEAAIDRLEERDTPLFRQIVIDHLPPILVETAGQRLWDDTPATYLKWIMAKALSTRIVYREGFEYLEAMPLNAIAQLAVRYLHLEFERRQLIDEVSASGMPHAERIASLLERAGIMTTMRPDETPEA